MAAQLQYKFAQLFSDQPTDASHKAADPFLTALYHPFVQQGGRAAGSRTEWAWRALSLTTAVAWGFVAYSFISATGWQGRTIISTLYTGILFALLASAMSERRKNRKRKQVRTGAEITVLEAVTSVSEQSKEPEDSGWTARAA